MPKEPYIAISFPESLLERVDALVLNVPGLGFRSRQEFAVSALREYVDHKEESAARALELRGKLPKARRQRLREKEAEKAAKLAEASRE